MKQFALIATVCTFLAASPVFAADDPTSAAVVFDNLNPAKNTKLHIREYWRSMQNKEVSWSGEAQNVVGGAKSRVKIFIADKSHPLYKGYNIVVTTGDIEKAAAIKIGQKVKFKGILHDYSAKRGGAIIELVDAQIL